jgi:ABC transport system ATP-binding/permease protein
MVKLVISDDVGATSVVPLVRDEISIGRGDGNTIRLTERNVSRKHAILKRNSEAFILNDLGSYNGVFINGKQAVGEVEVRPGDKIKIGDYVLSVEAEGEAQTKEVDPDNAVDLRDTIPIIEVSPAVSVPPARLVLLTPPTPGAEFSLRKNSTTRIGRDENLDVPIVHSSVSREHAEIRTNGEEVFLSDLGSSNGISVNGKRVAQSALTSGDIIEMGEVVLRYVAEGISYQFDPREASRYLQETKGVSKRQFQLGAVVAVAAIVLVSIIVWNRKGDSTNVTPLADEQPVSLSSGAGKATTVAFQAQQFERALRNCESALEGSRFAEAIAYAKKALEIKPSDVAAGECQQTANKGLDAEQIFMRGKVALDRGDAEGAYVEFLKLDRNSIFRQKPEVSRATEAFAKSQIDLAWALVKSDKNKAGQLAAAVLQMVDAPAEYSSAATEIRDALQKQEASKEPDRALSAAESNRRLAAAEKNTHRLAKSSPKPIAIETATPSAPIQQSSGPDQNDQARFGEASACLARGDNKCIIRLLAGKAKTTEELGLLIETYRSIGDSTNALANMALYVKRYPTSRRTASYQRILERNPK